MIIDNRIGTTDQPVTNNLYGMKTKLEKAEACSL
jgi:hypothetical protein